MKITQENIEKLGFEFKLKSDEGDCDYTFNKPSNRKGWIDLLVWHPETDNVILSQHTYKLSDIYNRGRLFPGTKMEDYIVSLFDLNFTSMGQLVDKLKELDIIK
jgi:hypothetical protein